MLSYTVYTGDIHMGARIKLGLLMFFLVGCGGVPFEVGPSQEIVDSGRVDTGGEVDTGAVEDSGPRCNGAPVYPGCPARYSCECAMGWCFCVPQDM